LNFFKLWTLSCQSWSKMY